jgi:hypothetical protein
MAGLSNRQDTTAPLLSQAVLLLLLVRFWLSVAVVCLLITYVLTFCYRLPLSAVLLSFPLHFIEMMGNHRRHANGCTQNHTETAYPANVGIVAMDVYFPSQFVDQRDLGKLCMLVRGMVSRLPHM